MKLFPIFQSFLLKISHFDSFFLFSSLIFFTVRRQGRQLTSHLLRPWSAYDRPTASLIVTDGRTDEKTDGRIKTDVLKMINESSTSSLLCLTIDRFAIKRQLQRNQAVSYRNRCDFLSSRRCPKEFLTCLHFFFFSILIQWDPVITATDITVKLFSSHCIVAL